VLLKVLLMEKRRGEGDGNNSAVRWTLSELATETHLSVSEIHYALRRLVETGLLRAADRRVNRHAIQEFLVHGIRYVFPPAQGRITRGMPTAYAAPPLKGVIISAGDTAPVWPFAEGTARGTSFSPLYSGAVLAALDDPEFYELLALTDTLRSDSRARERAAATDFLRSRLAAGSDSFSSV